MPGTPEFGSRGAGLTSERKFHYSAWSEYTGLSLAPGKPAGYGSGDSGLARLLTRSF